MKKNPITTIFTDVGGVLLTNGWDRAARRLAAQKFNFVDFFIVSCFVHFRKPDADIYRMALDIAQAPPEQVVYIDDRAMLVEVVRSHGLQAIHHTSYETTRAALAQLLH